MPTELIAILTQLPVVAIFIWYFERSNKANQEYLREERKAFLDELRVLSTEMRAIAQAVQDHDKKNDLAIAKMQERTKPRTERAK